MKDKPAFSPVSCQHLKCFCCGAMKAVNSFWYGAPGKTMVYTKSLPWLQEGLFWLLSPQGYGSTTSDHPGKGYSWLGGEVLLDKLPSTRLNQNYIRNTAPLSEYQFHETNGRPAKPEIGSLGFGFWLFGWLVSFWFCFVFWSLHIGKVPTHSFLGTMLPRILKHFPFDKSKMKGRAFPSLTMQQPVPENTLPEKPPYLPHSVSHFYFDVSFFCLVYTYIYIYNLLWFI